MIRKLLVYLVGIFLLTSGNTFGQDLPIFPYKLSPSERIKVLSKTQQEGSPSVKIPYLATNFVCREDVLELWDNHSRDSVLNIMNSALYNNVGTFSVTPEGRGVSIDATTGELSITGETGKEVEAGVYTVNLDYGSRGYEVFFFAPEGSNATSELWKTGPSYKSDMTNSFIVDGKEYIYVANNNHGMYVEMPDGNNEQILKAWAGDDLEVGIDPIYSGGVAEYPVHMLKFYNNVIVNLFTEDKEIVSRVANLSTVEYGKVEFDDVFINYDPEDPGTPDFHTSQWRGRIRYDNADGITSGTAGMETNPQITQAAFSDNGNLFYVRSKLDGSSNSLPGELYFIPTLQVLRMAGDDQIPVNPASSTNVDTDPGNLLNSRPIRIVDKSNNPLIVDLGDLVIKNPNSYTYSDFENYVKGFGLTLDKEEGGIWNDNWLTYLDPGSASSKVNGAHSLSEDWEFYFTSSEYTGDTDKSEWFVKSKIYKAKLDLSDLSDIKLVVQEEFPLNDVNVPVTGLGLDKNGCLFFIAGNTQFALVRIFGWGGTCPPPADISAPFVVIDTISDVNAQICPANSYDITSTVPDFLKTSTAYVHPKGEPYNPTLEDPVYQPELKKIVNVKYTYVNGDPISNPSAVGVGTYRVWVEQADNGNPNLVNGKYDLQGKCVENPWYYTVNVTIAPADIPNNINPPTAEVCYGETFNLESTTAWYDPNVYDPIVFLESDGTTLVTDATAVPAGDYFISITDNCSGNTEIFPYTVTETQDLTLDFDYPANNCGGVTISPIINSGDVSLGKFDFRIQGQTEWTDRIDATVIDPNSGDIIRPVAGTTYEVKYSVPDQGNGCGSFEVIKTVVIETDISNPDPLDIEKENDAGVCSALVDLTKPDINEGCASVTGLTITVDGVPVNLDPLSTNEYNFPVGVSVVSYGVEDSNGNPIPFEYTVTVTDTEAPVITGMPADIIVETSYPDCESSASWTEPTASDNCTSDVEVIVTAEDKDGVSFTPINGGSFPIGINTITYTVTDEAGNTVSESFTITVNDAHPPKIDASTFPEDVGPQCEPEVTLSEVQLTESCGSGTITNDFNPEGGGDASGTYPYGQTTVVTFTVKDAQGNVTDTKTLNVTINEELIVSIDGPVNVDDGYEFDLVANVTSGTVQSYDWTTVSGSVEFVRGSATEATAHVKIEGDATIQVEVESAEGCTAIAQINITSSGDCVIPNVITPNGDGYNDVFEVPCLSKYENNHMRIYDRWGQTVFETDNYQNNWNGTNQNGDLLTGTYYYEFTSSNQPTKSGYVVVVR
ncbi:MAG: gliding motility-associated C-terminal domain-containing protein [Bacteroidota bacterium]